MIKRGLIVFLLLTMVFCSGYRKPQKYTIQAEKNAFYHNSLGLNYLKDRIYYAAIQEFKIAISLNPDTQATAVFQNNLGETYLFIGYPEQAQPCFEDAIKLYGLNLMYYKNLVKCYKAQGVVEAKIKEFKASNDIYDRIKLGMLYIESGQYREGVNTLDELAVEEPDLMITPAIRQYISEVVKENL